MLALFMTGDALLLQGLIDAVQNAAWNQFWVLVCIICIYLPIQAVIYFARQSTAEEYANHITCQLREDLFAQLNATSVSQFNNQNADTYLSNLTVQVDSIKLDVIDVVL
ncbi:hypothetical protein ACFQY8_07925 [Alloscardovia venturai]|uniref:ABC transmembrane type-1 domain-containing protein n=1 Tax=Alloscardovia venturai TaxID=1769421 RepID=A0ABW2Y5X2_9BIFI